MIDKHHKYKAENKNNMYSLSAMFHCSTFSLIKINSAGARELDTFILYFLHISVFLHHFSVL